MKRSILPEPRFIAGLAELAPAYDVLLCDVWGVIHNGLAVFPAAAEALQSFRAKGGRVILISNAPLPNGSVRYKLDRLKMPRSAYDAIVTSGDVTVSEILARGDAPLFNIGPIFDRPLYRQVRKLSGRMPRLTKLEEAAFIVCTGLFDPSREIPSDYDPMLAEMRARNLDFLCANPDLVVHVGPQLLYCAGAIAERYEAIGGKVVQGGKPYAPIYQLALDVAESRLGKPPAPSRILAIGDAMRTDIKGAVAQSLDSLFIASGIHQDEILTSKIDGELDARAFMSFIEAAGFGPTAVARHLSW